MRFRLIPMYSIIQRNAKGNYYFNRPSFYIFRWIDKYLSNVRFNIIKNTKPFLFYFVEFQLKIAVGSERKKASRISTEITSLNHSLLMNSFLLLPTFIYFPYFGWLLLSGTALANFSLLRIHRRATRKQATSIF